MSDSQGGYGGGGSYGGPVVLYAASIHDAISSGDAGRQRAVAQAAEETLNQVDEIRAALQKLKAHLGNS